MTIRRGARAAALVVAVSALLGTSLFVAEVAAETKSIPTALWRVSAYLTDWSNILAVAVCLAFAVGSPYLTSPFWRLLATTAMVVMAVLFALIGGWASLADQGLSSVLTHVVTPALILSAWLLLMPRGGISLRDVPKTAVFPIIYLAWVFVRGAAGDGYPYPELDPTHAGWTGPALFAIGAMTLFIVFGAGLVFADRLLLKASALRR